ncbi:hypothetical protein [Protaetiibacter sp. SSC-01]|uniref:DUF7882 family protein n=1 Tax=Protaetiibacter sp. SSC-01 TaxID=2759943 RepID=UPI00292A5673|nr:hypothetical protein [Protaetiibacter sp. SSC-01]
MGVLHYADQAIVIDDRTLSHLKIAVVTKLRRGESFTLSWTHGPGEPRGRTTIWMQPSIPIRFEFDEAEPRPLSRDWIEQILRSSNSTGGIQLTADTMYTGDIPVVDAPSEPADGIPRAKTDAVQASTRRTHHAHREFLLS